jgi:hypothetical protein
MMALRKAGEMKCPAELTFRKFAATGKYLHENDIRWCIKNTKISSEKETIKWFKRFRTLCPKGEMNISQVTSICPEMTFSALKTGPSLTASRFAASAFL